MKRLLTACFCLLLLASCQGSNPQYYLNLYDIKPPSTKNFTHCFNYGCQTHRNVELPAKTERKLHKLFKPPAKTAKIERTRISKAIQIFETDIGALTGTKNDKHGTFKLYQDNAKTTQSFQQDCIDESTNTTIYLTLLNNMKLLKFHTPTFPASRQPFTGGSAWWHQTATMKEINTGERYAVDSWFFDNGAPAAIVPLKTWKKGWRPPKK